MGSGRSPIGGGAQKPAGGGGNGIFTSQDLKDIANAYDGLRARAVNNLSRNPNNSTYKDMEANYRDLRDAARNMDPNATTFSGLDAIVAMDLASKVGNVVEISGNGMIFTGMYQFQNVTAWGMSGKAWVQMGGGGHSFGYNPDTLASQLGLMRGGRYRTTPGRNVTVKLRQRR